MDGILEAIHSAMGNPAAATGFVAAAVVGIASSFHCFLMCGPLACAGLGGLTRKSRPIVAYHVGRTAAYALVGAFLGAVGGGISGALPFSLSRFFPWLMAAALVLSAFDLGKKLPAIPGLGRIVGRLGRLSAGADPTVRSATIGALTPLLPCGLLYGIYAAALASGGAGTGALVMLGFALGSGPALLIAQGPMKLLDRLPRGAAVAVRRGLPLVAAAGLVVRAILVTPEQPSCH
ncbi:MAG TPA: sulfite exporter TauE/SafE family protein [Fredinandcohnia sp.]|nr:sulfite exporter TauE/SafE family protein [Fredinandcohnia sp.]